MPTGNPKDEYLDASANQRQFQTIRFAQLTVYLALTGFLINLLSAHSAAMTPLVRILLKATGLISTLLFWIHQVRTEQFWTHFVKRAAELEEELGFRQYTTRPPSGIVSSFKAMRAFFALLTLFWIASFIWMR